MRFASSTLVPHSSSTPSAEHARDDSRGVRCSATGGIPGPHVGGAIPASLARVRIHLVRCQMHLRASYCSPRPMFLHRLDRLIRAHEIVRDAERVGR